MFSHIHVGARDLPRLVEFYDSILSVLGMVKMPEGNGGSARGVGWHLPGKRWPQFYVQMPLNGLPSTWGNGVQISFLANSQADVEKIWALALKMGGTDEGSPGYRLYAADFYAAYCRDPEGNKLCIVHAPDEEV